MPQLNYHLTDPTGNQPVVTLLHGLFGSLDNLAVIRRGLENDFQVLSVDLPDHGQSSRTTAFSFEQYRDHLLALLSELNISRTHIVGHSLGGKLAMYTALTAPQVVEKLVVADIAPVHYTPRHQAVLAGLANVDLANTRDRKHADAQLAEHVREPGVRQFLLKSLYRDDTGWQWRFNLPMLSRDYGELSQGFEGLGTHTGETLFVKGGESDYLTEAHRPVINQLFPNSQAKIIQGTGHWLHAEKPDAFNRILDRFLSA